MPADGRDGRAEVRKRRAPQRGKPGLARENAGDPAVVAALRQEMWSHVGLVREHQGLARALSRLHEWRNLPELGGEARNLADVGALVAQAALDRRESRGGHYRSDYPESDPALQRRRFWIGFEAEAPEPRIAEAGR